MKKRHWTSKEKARIVLEGLSEQIEIAKLCHKYQIAQTQIPVARPVPEIQPSDLWGQEYHKEQRLIEENKKLKNIIGDLTVELKKSEYELWSAEGHSLL